MKCTVLLLLSLAFNPSVQEDVMIVLLSFKTDTEHSFWFAEDTKQNALVLRYGSKEHVELEIIDYLNDSLVVFTQSGYYRGGGVDNAGLDLNYFHFSHEGYDYTIFDEYSAEGVSQEYGVRIEAAQGSGLPPRENILPADSVVGGFSYTMYEGRIPAKFER